MPRTHYHVLVPLEEWQDAIAYQSPTLHNCDGCLHDDPFFVAHADAERYAEKLNRS